ncbi:MAG: membrane lipoprotein lipid attachment site-containing protein [Prevotella sp.]|nr:membrane lipoprotein lipid attachment site-containing protein [Prevotella sp.]
MRKIIFGMVAVLLLAACGETKTRQEINRRKAALKEKQETELRKAQEDLRLTDSLLVVTNRQLDSLQQQVDAHKKALKATPEELTLLTLTRMKRDSIRTQFEVLGAKIRYIREKMKEVKSEEVKSEG